MTDCPLGLGSDLEPNPSDRVDLETLLEKRGPGGFHGGRERTCQPLASGHVQLQGACLGRIGNPPNPRDLAAITWNKGLHAEQREVVRVRVARVHEVCVPIHRGHARETSTSRRGGQACQLDDVLESLGSQIQDRASVVLDHANAKDIAAVAELKLPVIARAGEVRVIPHLVFEGEGRLLVVTVSFAPE